MCETVGLTVQLDYTLLSIRVCVSRAVAVMIFCQPVIVEQKTAGRGRPGWRSGLGHCIAVLAVPPETLGSRPRSVAAGRNREVRGATHNWPSVVQVREGLAGREILVLSHTSDSCGGPGAVHVNQGCQVHGVSSDTLVWLASKVGCALC